MIARLKRKTARLAAALPVLAGALLFAALLALVAWVLVPRLPGPMTAFLSGLADQGFDQNRAALKAWFEGFGTGAAWVFLAVQFLQVVVAPIPGQLTGMLGGFVFGFWPGLALNVAGNAAGSVTAMLLTRVFGERVMRPFIPREIQDRFDQAVTRGGVSNFFMLFLLPGTPKDSLCFMAGLTRLPLWRLMAVNTLGRLPGLAVLTFTGAAADRDLGTVQLVFGLGLGLAALAWLFDEELKETLARLAGHPVPQEGPSPDDPGDAREDARAERTRNGKRP